MDMTRLRPFGVRAGLCFQAPSIRTARSSIVIVEISTIPPISSASVNCQPISTHMTMPSSTTRFVEANWNASALAEEAPAANSDLAIAIAAYEQDDDAAPSPLASATGRTPPAPSARSMRTRGAHACTAPEIVNPSTSAHHTCHAISSAFCSPSHSVSIAAIAAPVCSIAAARAASGDRSDRAARAPREIGSRG